MHITLLGIAVIVIGYLLGSFPTAYIVAKLRKGIDIRNVDVGNMGGGSVLRQVGLWEGSLVILIDMAKGAAAVLIALALELPYYWVLAAGFASIVGHNFPVFLGFRGGQGVATIMGILFVLAPLAIGALWILLGIVILITRRNFIRYLFLIICVVAPLLPLTIWLVYGSGWLVHSSGPETWALIYLSLSIIALLVFKNRRRLKEFRIFKEKFGKGQ
jgi:glycerol-3-phosphate acyltransferase PlsY